VRCIRTHGRRTVLVVFFTRLAGGEGMTPHGDNMPKFDDEVESAKHRAVIVVYTVLAMIIVLSAVAFFALQMGGK
jgi:hypothetical protein